MARKGIRIISAIVLFLTIWFLWPRELDGFMLGRDGRLAVPDYAMSNARYVSVRSGKVEMESQAQEASFDLLARRMDAKDVTAYFYNVEGAKTKVTADRAEFFMDGRRMHLMDNVKSLSPDGFEMRGPEADYFVERRFFSAPQPIEGEMEDQSLRIWGNRAESSLDDRKVFLYGDARAHYVQPKQGLTKIRGDWAVLDREKELAEFHKDVRVDQEKTVATGENAELYFAKEQKMVRYMSILGNVRIQEEKGRYTRSQVAEFFAPSDTVVLTGFPSVYNGDDAVTGDKITLYRATGVVEVTATNAAASPFRQEPGKQEAPTLTKEDEELIP